MVYLLTGVTFLFVFLNYELGKHDYLYPPFIFSFVFFFFSVICSLGAYRYDVHLGLETIAIILVGLFVFSFIFVAFIPKKININRQNSELEFIEVSHGIILIIVILQVISIFFFIRYLRNLTTAYASAGYTNLLAYNVSGMIKLYDTLTKFWEQIYVALAVPIPVIYRITNPICSAFEYILFYIDINNFLIRKRIYKSHILVLILAIIRILLNGSRSPLLRIATFFLIVFYVLKYRQGRLTRGSYRLLGKIIIFSFGLFFIMIALLYIMGRATQKVDLIGSAFTYVGAPIVNLDIFIKRYDKQLIFGAKQNYYGAQTFGAAYKYFGKLFGKDIQIKSFAQFEFSGGYEIGNVYTMFASILYDFGIFGIIPIVGLMAIYYGASYYRIMYSSNYEKFDFTLFIYAYLINDVFMSAFSNRFYETVLDAPFIKFLILSWLIKSLLIDHSIKIGRFLIRIHGKKRVGIEWTL